MWLIHSENELLAAVADRGAVHRPPDVPDERLLQQALETMAADGNRGARKVLSRAAAAR
ncbi:MAG: hypothetical protein ABSG43_03455 [Solirubrobacteraceae bacterium]|jgi:hypothetical protein